MIDFKICRKEMEWGGAKLVLETGKIARQATGAVVAKLHNCLIALVRIDERKISPVRVFNL